MKITHIYVTAGRGFNHPREQYSNFKFDLQLQGELEPGEDPAAALVKLQQEAEQAAEAHKACILSDIERQATIQAVLGNLEYEKRKAFDSEASKATVAKLEEQLTALTSRPLMLAGKAVHAGHPDHPDTDIFGED